MMVPNMWKKRFGDDAAMAYAPGACGPSATWSEFGRPVSKPFGDQYVVVTEDRVICLGGQGHLHGYDLEGRRAYVCPPPESIRTLPQNIGPVVFGEVVVQVLMHGVAGYRASTGKMLWCVDVAAAAKALGRRLTGKALIYDSVSEAGVCVRAYGGVAFLIRPSDGALSVLGEHWPILKGVAGPFCTRVDANDDHVLVRVADPMPPLLRIGRSGAIMRALLSGNSYVLLDDNWLTACNVDTMTIAWQLPAYLGNPCECFGSLACDGQVLYYRYAGAKRHTLVAINLADGSILWQRLEMPGVGNPMNVHSLAVTGDRIVYLAGIRILLLDKQTGETLWTSEHMAELGTIMSGPCLAHGRAWVAVSGVGLRVIG